MARYTSAEVGTSRLPSIDPSTRTRTKMCVANWVKKGRARRLARWVSGRSRAKKVALIRNNIAPGARVLLVGASPAEGIGTESAVEIGLLEHAEITCLVYEPYEGDLWGRPTVRGDARELPCPDSCCDYVLVSEVIASVGGSAGHGLALP